MIFSDSPQDRPAHRPILCLRPRVVGTPDGRQGLASAAARIAPATRRRPSFARLCGQSPPPPRVETCPTTKQYLRRLLLSLIPPKVPSRSSRMALLSMTSTAKSVLRGVIAVGRLLANVYGRLFSRRSRPLVVLPPSSPAATRRTYSVTLTIRVDTVSSVQAAEIVSAFPANASDPASLPPTSSNTSMVLPSGLRLSLSATQRPR